MSSFIEWPTIYGSVYFLPGIAVVVLLLALLLLMSSRRRAEAERDRLAPDPLLAAEETTQGSAEPQPGFTTQAGMPASPAVMTQPVSMMPQPTAYSIHPAVMTQPVMMGRPDHPGMMAQPAFMTQNAAGMHQPAVMTQPVGLTQTRPVPVHGLPLVPPPFGAANTAPMHAPVATVAVPVAAPMMAAPVAAAPMAAAPATDPLADLIPEKSGRKSKPVKTKQSGRPGPYDITVISNVGNADPLYTTINEVLNGWGDLAPEDLKRLELFRPDRLSAALMAMQPPKSKSNDAKQRLDQMRRYAMDMERRAHADRANQAVAAAAAAAASPMMTAPQMAAPVIAALAMPPVQAPVVVQTPAATVTPVQSPSMRDLLDEPLEQRSPIFTGYAGIDELPAPMAPPTVAAPTVATPAVAAPAAEEEIAPASLLRDVQPATAVADDQDVDWTKLSPLWPPEAAVEELPAPTFHEVEMEPVEVPSFGADLGGSFGAAASPSAPAVRQPVSSTRVMEAPVRALPDFTDGLLWDDDPMEMSRLNVKVETAEQLLALPAHERLDMVALLPAPELVATFRATRDPELKRAVIDTLEHIGTPASLNMLGNCFEDHDPHVQMYALAAADRLLGVIQ